MSKQPPVTAGQDLSAIRGLLKTTLPRASRLRYYDAARRCVWSSDGSDDGVADEFVASLAPHAADAQARGALERRLAAGDRLYAFAAPAGDDDPSAEAGFLVVRYDHDPAANEPPSWSLVAGLCESALAVLSETFADRRRIERLADCLDATRRELDLIYGIDEKLEQSPHGQASLARLVGTCAQQLRIGYCVLLLPAKRIRIGVTHPYWKAVDREALDTVIVQRFLPKLTLEKRLRRLDVPEPPKKVKSLDGSYEVLLCAIREEQKRVIGVLALLAQVDGRPLDGSAQRLASLIARRIESVVAGSYDPMTGLMNRDAFEAHMGEAYDALTGDSDTHCLIMFDLDKLQLVNDNFDQKAGDEVLRRFAGELQDGLPQNGLLSRLSEDNFAALLLHATVDDGVAFAERIRERAHSLSYLQGDKSLRMSVSAGVASFDRSVGSYKAAMIPPQVACTAAKDHGRDRVEVYDQDNQSMVRRIDDVQLVAQIDMALDTGSFELLAQPIEPLHGERAGAYHEILVRMTSADSEPLRPQAFFSAAERYQMMPKVDRWVVSRTCAMLAESAAGAMAPETLFALNLSGQSLGDEGFLDFVKHAIADSAVPAERFCFEITETAAVANMEQAVRFIEALRKLGCRFSLDDFGAGLSSFAYLKKFPVQTLKIDGSFVRDVVDNRISESMVAAITQVARVMELTTIAEYVESEATRRRVQALGVDFAQGYAIGEPRPLAEVLAGLALPTDAAAAS